jgi:hypothetical protein
MGDEYLASGFADVDSAGNSNPILARLSVVDPQISPIFTDLFAIEFP